jgi:hypothetical protein
VDTQLGGCPHDADGDLGTVGDKQAADLGHAFLAGMGDGGRTAGEYLRK